MKPRIVAMLITKVEEYKSEGKTITAISLQKPLYDLLELAEDKFFLDVKEITLPVHNYPDFCESYMDFKYANGSVMSNVKIGWDLDKFEIVLQPKTTA